jgi:hypothetical protein
MGWEPTPDQRSALEQVFLEELLKLRAGQQKSATENSGEQKPGWLRFLESTGGAALITVVLGTLGGAAITGLIQSFSQGQQARQLSISEYLKGEHDTVKAVFDMVGRCIAAAENLNTITTQGFDPANFPEGDQRNLVLVQKNNLRDEFNKWDEQWRASRETLTLNLRYYHGNDPALGSAWDNTRDALSSYMDCQQGWYMQHLRNSVDESVAADACKGEQKSLDSALTKFSEALTQNRLYSWGEPKSR